MSGAQARILFSRWCWWFFFGSSCIFLSSCRCCYCWCWTTISPRTAASAAAFQGRQVTTFSSALLLLGGAKTHNHKVAGRGTRSVSFLARQQLRAIFDKDAEDPSPRTTQQPPQSSERNDDLDAMDASLHQALQQRVAALEEGIGKRYVCRTQIGFLNVHESPGDPFRTDNVVGRLVDGDIVASTGPPQGDWIQHDGGGWSIAVYSEFVWLQELKE